MARTAWQGCCLGRRHAGLGWLLAAAIAAGGLVTPAVHAVSVSCSVVGSAVAAATSDIASKDGYADAVVAIAAYACGETPRNTSVDDSIAVVASAMADVVGSVSGTCTGTGAGTIAKVFGYAKASAEAEAVGNATARIITDAGVCSQCKSTLKALRSVVMQVAVTAVVEVQIEEDIQFTAGEPQTVTVSDAASVMEEEIVDELTAVTRQLRAASVEECNGSIARTSPPLDIGPMSSNRSACDATAVADGIQAELGSVTSLAASVAALACSGEGAVRAGRAALKATAADIAGAVAEAVTSAKATCEPTGGPDTLPCGISDASVKAVAVAQAAAFTRGLRLGTGAKCVCKLTKAVSVPAIGSMISEALFEACVGGESSDIAAEVQETLGEAIAGVVLTELRSDACMFPATATAKAPTKPAAKAVATAKPAATAKPTATVKPTATARPAVKPAARPAAKRAANPAKPAATVKPPATAKSAVTAKPAATAKTAAIAPTAATAKPAAAAKPAATSEPAAKPGAAATPKSAAKPAAAATPKPAAKPAAAAKQAAVTPAAATATPAAAAHPATTPEPVAKPPAAASTSAPSSTTVATPFPCAAAGVCVAPDEVCSSPDGILPCCGAADVCARFPGRAVFRCQPRQIAETTARTTMRECIVNHRVTLTEKRSQSQPTPTSVESPV